VLLVLLLTLNFVHVLNDDAKLATKEYRFRLDCNCHTRFQQNTSSGSPG